MHVHGGADDSPTEGPATAAFVWGAVRLVHPFPVFMVVCTSLVLLLVAHGGNPGVSTLWRAGGVVLLSQIAVGALNDFSDRYVDAIGQRYKPIPSGLVDPRFALGLVLCSLTALVPLAATFGPAAFTLTAVGTGAGLAYDRWWKPTPFSILGYLIGFPTLITWIWLVAGHLTASFFLIYPAGALLLVSAHLSQSFPDIESDQSTGQRGLAASLGPSVTFTAIIAPVAIVSLGGLVIALHGRSQPGVLLNLAAILLLLTAMSLRSSTVKKKESRTLLFRLIAPAIALVVLGSLMALSSIV